MESYRHTLNEVWGFRDRQEKSMSKTIDATPSWCTAMDLLIHMMENGEAEGRELAKQELRDLAVRLDKLKENDDA